jgi:hypothetical protein
MGALDVMWKGHRSMTSALRSLVPLAVVLVFPQLAWAQKEKDNTGETVTIVEPGTIKLANLFEMADTVALVRVVSGDAENYSIAVYKAVVTESFEGAAVGETVYYGPYVGHRVGWDYVLFLRNVAKPLVPKTTSSTNYGTVHYSEVFNEGYSSMETSYECVFDGKEIAEQCDYGVRICTDYIVLPK